MWLTFRFRSGLRRWLRIKAYQPSTGLEVEQIIRASLPTPSGVNLNPARHLLPASSFKHLPIQTSSFKTVNICPFNHCSANTVPQLSCHGCVSRFLVLILFSHLWRKLLQSWPWQPACLSEPPYTISSQLLWHLWPLPICREAQTTHSQGASSMLGLQARRRWFPQCVRASVLAGGNLQ